MCIKNIWHAQNYASESECKIVRLTEAEIKYIEEELNQIKLQFIDCQFAWHWLFFKSSSRNKKKAKQWKERNKSRHV